MMKTRIFSLLAALTLLLGCVCFTAFAHEVPDLTRTGTIEMTLVTSGGNVVEGAVTIYRVGDIVEDDGNYSFALSEDFEVSELDADDVQSPEVAAALAECVSAYGMEGVTEQIDGEGHVIFTVDPGLYLLVQTEVSKVSGVFNPFLISIPNMEDGIYVYEVDAAPKVSPIADVTEAPTVPETTKPAPVDETLPQTGQLNWPVPMLALLGLFLFIAGWVLRYRNRKENG